MKRTATKYAVSQRKRTLRRNKANARARSGSTAASASRKPADIKDYAGDPVKFLGDFFSGGVFRK